jgi:hypothetical protein
MLGELNWIFTAITDTIAWNTLPRGLSFFSHFTFETILLFLWMLLAEGVCLHS